MAKVLTRTLKTKEVHYTTAEGVGKSVRIDDVPEKKIRAAVSEIEGSDNFIINSTETVTERYAMSIAEFIKHAQKIELKIEL